MLGTILLIVVLSLVAIIAEMVLPGGILGIAGVAGLLVAVVLIFNEYGMVAGLAATLALLAFCISVFWFWMKYFHRLPFTRKMVHRTEVGDDVSRTGVQSLTGKTGTAVTALSPSGKALIEGERLDVIAESGFIDRDSPLRVVGTSGATLVVRGETAPDS